jgi:hypothetical protein
VSRARTALDPINRPRSSGVAVTLYLTRHLRRYRYQRMYVFAVDRSGVEKLNRLAAPGFGASSRRSEPQATNKRSPSRSTSGPGSGAGDTVMVSNSSSLANAAGATLPNFVASTSKCFSKATAIAARLIATS